MKLTKYLAGFAAFAFASTSHANVTVSITGATAFRAATLSAIKAQYLLGNTNEGGASFKFAHSDATTLTNANTAIFIGSFPGVSGTTTIVCNFTGSVEGVAALMPEVPSNVQAPPTYYQPSLLASTTATPTGAELANQGATGVAALGTTSDIAFSDVGKDSTPYGKYSAFEDRAGVIVFCMVTNNGSTITNVTSQQFRAVLGKGPQPLSLFTGLSADDASFVVGMGRNDGSGTRTTYLAESGFGFVNPVQQYVLNTYTAGTPNVMNKLQLVPALGVSTLTPAGNGANCSTAANKSLVWGQTVDGNGGYNSGSSISTAMGMTGASVSVYGASGSLSFTGNVSLVSWLGTGDSMTTRNNGGKIIGYNGVTLTEIAANPNPTDRLTQLGTNDKLKISRGQYTAWGYERIMRNRNISSGDKLTVYTNVLGEIPNQIGTAGMLITDMVVGRDVDGGVVSP
ncbi:MAG: hypothetical protein WCP45_06270 [Verrucomicrobiota bacterium]